MNYEQIKAVNDSISFAVMVAKNGHKNGNLADTLKHIEEMNLPLPTEIVEHLKAVVSGL